MFTVFKLTLANIRQKKFRTALIIITIINAVALIYTVLSLSGSINKIFEQDIKKEVGNAELMLLPPENSGELYMKELDFSHIDGAAYHIPVVMAYGYTDLKDEMIAVTLNGMSAKDYDEIYHLEFLPKSSEILKDNQVFIGKITAEKYGLSIGDEINVNIGGINKSYIISGIIRDNNNSLSYSSGNMKLMIARETLNKDLKLENKVNYYFIRTSADVNLKNLTKNLKAAFPDLQVKDVTDMSDYKQFIDMIGSILLLMVLVVIIVSAFLIYSSFKVIAIERMPLMGTLRSIGATRKLTVRTLLYEAFFYGVIGGAAGIGIGVLLLSISLRAMFRAFHVTLSNISCFNINYSIITIIIGLTLAIGSAILPIIKISRKSIRSIIFSEVNNEKNVSAIKTVIGFIVLVMAFIIFQIAPLKLQVVLNFLGILMVFIGSAMAIPMLSRVLTKFLELLLKPIYKDEIDIVTANIKNDRTMMNNIMLLAMGLGVILMVNNFSSTVGRAVTDLYATGKADVIISYDYLNKGFIDKVSKTDGVEHVYAMKEVRNLTANNHKIDLQYLEGIDGRGFCDYAWNEFGRYLTDDLIKTFTDKRSIIISKFTAKKYGLEKGDMLKIDFKGKTLDYQIIGIVPTIMNNGNLNFINEKFFTEDFEVINYQSMFLNIKKNADIKAVMKHIKELMPQVILPMQTLDEMRSQNKESNNAIFLMMKAISVIAMLIGIIGILNNFTISFISRKKLMATLRSLGLNKKRTIHNMLMEAFFCGSLGTVLGLALGTVLLTAMCYLIEALGISAEVMFFSIKDYVFVLISGISLSLISAVMPAFNIVKGNIVAGLRYE